MTSPGTDNTIQRPQGRTDRVAAPISWGPVGWLCAVLLGVLGVTYVGNGVMTLLAPSKRDDLDTRWRENRYLREGVDPYDVSVQFKGMTPSATESTRIAEHHLENESALDPSGYPPWGLAASFAFIPPGSLQRVHGVFAVFCLLSLGLTVGWAFVEGRRWGAGPGLLMAAAVLAMFGNASTLRLGQYGLVLNAFLLLSAWATARGRLAWSGLAMAVAAIKPNYSAAQVALLISRRQWTSLLVVAVVCAAASCVPWALTGVDPIEMVRQMLYQSSHVTEGDTGLLGLARLAMPYPAAVTTLGLIALTVTLSTGWMYRNASPWVAMSAAAVMGRLFLYHRQYDNVMLVFPLLTLGLLALTIRKPWAWLVFAVYGATLWIPISYPAYRPPLIAALCTVWVAGLVVICRNAERVP